MITSINTKYSPAFMGKKYVIGHKNPDTDSVCSAIAYSNLSEQKKTNENDYYVPLCAGDINKETEFALAYFKIKPPRVIKDLSLKIKDTFKPRKIKEISISNQGSLRELYNLMYTSNLEEVPVLDENKKIVGIITPKDIMQFNLRKEDVLEELKHKNIPFNKFSQLLDAKVLAGEEFLEDTLKGNVKMGVYSFDTTSKSNLKDAMVLVGDREDIQEEVINQGAKALVITKNKQPSQKIIQLAKEKDLIILSTQYGTSSSAKLIEQSYPVSDIMNDDIVSFEVDETIDDIKTMAKESQHQVFPITKDGVFVGLMTLDEIIKPEEKEVILVDHNNQGQFVEGISKKNITEIIDHHRQEFISDEKRIPVTYSDVGATATMVARSYKANSIPIEKNIAGILWCAIVSDTDNFSSVTTTPEDIKIANELAEIAEIDDKEKLAKQLLAQRDVALNGLKAMELVNYDRKEYSLNDNSHFSVGQILTFEIDKYLDTKNDLISCLNKTEKSDNFKGTALMLTDMADKTTHLLCSEGIQKVAIKLLHKNNNNFLEEKIENCNSTYREILDEIVKTGKATLQNVCSRKEQVEPFLREVFNTYNLYN